METERNGGSCRGHRIGIQSHATPGHGRSSAGEKPSRKGRCRSHRPEAAAVRGLDGGGGRGQRLKLRSHPCPSGTWQRTWGDLPRPSRREGPWPLACGLPFLPLAHRVPVPGLRASGRASGKRPLFAIHISTPEERGQHAGRLPKQGAPAF